LPEAFYHVAGFHPCGTRAVRIDILERLADQIRPLVAWRPDPANSNPPPKGATGNGGFRVTPDMMSILGCSSSDVGEILHKLGFRLERVPLGRVEEKRAPKTDDAAPAAERGTVADAGAPAEAVSPASVESGVASEVDGTAEPAPEGAVLEAGEAVQGSSGEAVPTPAVESEQETAAAEPKLEEIWRPRRQGRHPDRGRRRPAGAVAGEPAKSDARPRREGKEGRHGEARSGDGRPGEGRRKDGRQHKRFDRHERRQGAPGRREERPVRHSASPAPKAGIDPDSPFAALSSLKAALEKQGQE
jgi:ATP-dependent RNA helicase SUPV3L1/SUV3